ncbi:MAG TPA: hypothetical protein DCQ06_08515, partial [Myxococcales bacterium]|nr:hypothetical protein [Myxococcales bacterium]
MQMRLWCLALCCVVVSACVDEPVAVYREVVHLKGAPYERGLDHGKRLRPRIRAFYTQLLDTALLPNLNREQPAIAGFLKRYAGPSYADGQFSYRVLLEMAQSVETQLPDRYIDEMRGIADGSGLTYEQVLILNTFPDTVLAVRSVAATLRLSRGPRIKSWQLLGWLNDQGAQRPAQTYSPSFTALAAEVPTDVRIRLVLTDPEGISADTVRLQLDTRVFPPGDPAVTTKALPNADGNMTDMEVILTPPEPMPAATVLSLIVQSADTTIADDPLPAHPRFGREETLTLSTLGYGLSAEEVANVGVDDGRTRPPPVAFALKGSATKDGAPLLAQHFALLDAGAAHEATTVFIHHPTPGEDTRKHAYVSWAGLTWGFSGMNTSGLAWACNFSDTLDTAILKDLIPQLSKLDEAQLTATGWPIGLAMREVSRSEKGAQQGVEILPNMQHVNGWNCLLADADGQLRLAEIDADAEAFPNPLSQGVTVVQWQGSAVASAASDTEDDLRAAVHYVSNTQDVDSALPILAESLLAPTGAIVRVDVQREVSTYFFKSLLAFHKLGKVLAQGRGSWDVAMAQQVLGRPAFVDPSDSMNAVVMEPSKGLLHNAMGKV